MLFRFSILIILFLNVFKLIAQTDLDAIKPKCLFTIYADLVNKYGVDIAKNILLKQDGNYQRSKRQQQLVTNNKHFRLHYDISGVDAVSMIDKDLNSIPDYIDSANYYLERTYEIQINQLGYKPPPADNLNPKQGDVGPEIDLYFCNLPQEIYGGAQPEDQNKIDDNRLCSYMVLDNDYKGYPTSGYNGLRVTIAHEFHHVVQLAGYRSDLSQRNFYEATSVWMERIVEPTILDYINYVKKFLDSPQKYPFSTHTTQSFEGYCHVLYFDYITQKLDNKNIIKESWELFAENGKCFTSIDNALKKYGLNLENSYCEFGKSCYYTGIRADDSVYLKDGSKYPTMKPSITQNQGNGNLTFAGELFPLCFGLYRSIFNAKNGVKDTIDFVVTNGRSNIGSGGVNLDPDNFNIEISTSEFINSKPIYRSYDTLFYNFTGSMNSFCNYVITGGEAQLSIATTISPQPFINDGGNKLVLNSVFSNDEIKSVKAWVYSSSMNRIAELKQTGLVNSNNILGLVWDGLDYNGKLVESGIYIYEIVVNNKYTSIGKFAIVGK